MISIIYSLQHEYIHLHIVLVEFCVDREEYILKLAHCVSVSLLMSTARHRLCNGVPSESW